jgi:LAO/AO transport system kinase
MTAPARRPSARELADGLLAGNRTLLARAITMVESRRPDDQAVALDLLDLILPHTGGSLRVGITGAPGVGKSSFIDRFGAHLVASGRKLAVLAVDPSSTLTGGSILGDKTRMQELSLLPEAFVRPSPSAGTLGGAARKTREAMLLCEAAGFDTILIETVGVGQSEAAVADMVDLLALLLLPAGGDDLQGIKRGILERADLLIINKADGLLESTAKRTARDYASALHVLPRDRNEAPPVLLTSALTGAGIDEVWQTLLRLHADALASGEAEARRRAQRERWLTDAIATGIEEALAAQPEAAAAHADAMHRVTAGLQHPARAAGAVVAAFLRGAADPKAD